MPTVHKFEYFLTFFQWTWYLILSKLFILYFWKSQFIRLLRPFRWLGLKFCTSHIIDIYIVDNKRRLGLPKKFLNGKLNFRFTVSFSIFFLCTNKKKTVLELTWRTYVLFLPLLNIHPTHYTDYYHKIVDGYKKLIMMCVVYVTHFEKKRTLIE